MMSVRGVICVLVAVGVVGCRATRLADWVAAHTNSDSPEADTSCAQVKRKYVDLGFGAASSVPQNKLHDSNMEICYRGVESPDQKSCCTRDMELRYQRAAEHDFYEVLRATSSYLKNVLTTNTAHYQELFLKMVSSAHNRTETIFNDVYKLPVTERRGPTDTLFMDLNAYIRRREVNIHESVQVFFTELFPLVYHHNVNDPRRQQMDDEYRECLMEVRQELYPRPFGDAPAKLAHQLAKSFGTARAFLEALHLGIEAINTTDYMPLEAACRSGLTRLEYCAYCDSGHDTVRPCKAFCFNVMRGCLAGLIEVDTRWTEFVDALELLTTNMRGPYDLEEVLLGFHSKVSEGIMHAMETGYKFNEKVVAKCGHPTALSEQEAAASPHQKLTPPARGALLLGNTPRPQVQLRSKVEMFMRNLVSSKGFYRTLPDTLCSAERFSAGIHDRCWNGLSIGPYNKTLAPLSVEAQRQLNPEVTYSGSQPPTLTALTDKLTHVRKLLHSKVHSELMQADQWSSYSFGDSYGSGYNNDGDRPSGGRDGQGHRDWQDAGSGYYNKGFPVDDEDSWGSGSGSGGSFRSKYPNTDITNPKRKPSPEKNPDFTFVDANPKTTSSPYKPASTARHNPMGGAASCSHSATLLLLTALGGWLLW